MAAAYKALSKTSSKKPIGEDASKINGAADGIKYKQRVLILSSRGVTFRHRHILHDIHSLLPHSRKEAKLDTKTKLYQLNELADLYNCNNVLFFESRKGKDLYLWMSKVPNGPTVKMHMHNLHTMSELHFPGNCLKGSRPILSFDKNFTTAPHLMVVKDLLTHIFAVPPGSRKSKPFVDHVMGFTIADNKIWVRCFEIKETQGGGKEQELNANELELKDVAVSAAVNGKDGTEEVERRDQGEPDISLVEIGPRFVLTPIVILESSFGGPVIYENKEFVSPNQLRRDIRLGKASRRLRRDEQEAERKTKRGDLGLRSGTASKRKRRKEDEELDESVLFR